MKKIVLLIFVISALFADNINIKELEKISSQTEEITNDINITENNKYSKIKNINKKIKEEQEKIKVKEKIKKLKKQLKINMELLKQQYECIDKAKTRDDIYTCGDNYVKFLNKAIEKIQLNEWSKSDYDFLSK